MQTALFDIDNTIVCSKHRYTALPNGDIDLLAWVRDNTRENCFKDSLLPAIRTLRNDYRFGFTVILCTARVLSAWDYDFFKENDIPFHVMLDRPKGCMFGDADLKEFQLRLYAHQHKISWRRFCETSMFFEDNPSVLDRMAEIGIETVDAVAWNKKLAMTL